MQPGLDDAPGPPVQAALARADVSPALRRAIGLHRENRLDEAEAAYRRIRSRSPEDSDVVHLLGVIRFQRGDQKGAVELIRRAVRQSPDEALYQRNLGSVLLLVGDAVAARKAALQALRSDPAAAETHYLLGLCLRRLGRPEEAAAALKRAVARSPEYTEACFHLGAIAEEGGRIEAAMAWYRKALAGRSDFVPALIRLGNLLGRRGQFGESLACHRRAIRVAPNSASAHNNMGITLSTTGRREAASRCFRRAIAIQPRFATAHNNLGLMLAEEGRSEEAIAHFRKAIEIAPGYLDAHNNLVTALERLNRLEAAGAAQAALRGRTVGNFHTAVNEAQLAFRAGEAENARKILERAMDRTPEHPLAPNAVHLLGKVCDRLGDVDAAFAAFEAAKRRIAAVSPLSAHYREKSDRYLTQIRRWHQSMTPSLVDGWDGRVVGNQWPTPVFLVGFPRSGTTLVDQVLNAHPEVSTLEERPTLSRITGDFFEIEEGLGRLNSLTEETIQRYRTDYWERVRQWSGEAEGTLMVDKLPLNIIYLGLIRRFFPDARVIVVLRDPRDAVLSNFMQFFELNKAMYHFLTLEGAARFYGAVMGLYLRAKEVLGLTMLEIRYEELVADMAKAAGHLTDFLQVPREDAMLNYHEQARHRRIKTPSYAQVVEPVYRTSVSRWMRYRHCMAAAEPLLEPYVRAFGYPEVP